MRWQTLFSSARSICNRWNSKHYFLVCFFQNSSVQGSLEHALFSNMPTLTIVWVVSQSDRRINRRQSLHILSVWLKGLNKHTCTHSTLHTNHSTVRALRGLAWDTLLVDISYCEQVSGGMKPTFITKQNQCGISLPSVNTRSNGPHIWSCHTIRAVELVMSTGRWLRPIFVTSESACRWVCVRVRSCVWVSSWQGVNVGY
jgi:hypothetical protein